MDADRIRRGAEIAMRAIENGGIERQFGRVYRVDGDTDTYTVSLDTRECSRPDARYRQKHCKHLIAAAIVDGARA